MALPIIPILTALSVYTATRIITALGFGFIVFTGLDSLHQQFYDNVYNNLSQTPQAILSIATLFGFVEYSKIILGAFAIKIGFMVLKRFGPL